MKNRKIIIYFVIFILLSLLVYFLVYKNNDSYSTSIITYTKNGSYVAYPQIDDLKDKKKQDKINRLLKDQILFGAKNYMGKYIVDFSYPDYVYEFSSGVGLANEDIASFWYSFNSYGEVIIENEGVMRDTYRFFCITIDMKTGEKIELPDFMIIDERLINSNDGSGIETDYNSEANPVFHNFKDAFMIYTLEQEKDVFHLFTPQEIIDRLMDTQSETNWYIDETKNIVFCSGKSSVKIPYNKISDAIYPKYSKILNK
ncbi:hypothetical protein [Clostridium sp. HBUAS56010]|uniref:hypothetical protein n=1 Tax=Clostridium sp. HBUAS56010 TaxID=2571127 RepID=UPI001177BDB8|nr:hypothetical protein [Clostridium sp. HBUAS56010]